MPPASQSRIPDESKGQRPSADPLKLGSAEAATKSNSIEISQITLPKGGGALKGIDEKFQVNAAYDSPSFSIPLPLSLGRSGFQPSLAPSYNTSVRNSLFAVKWGLRHPPFNEKRISTSPYQDYEYDLN